MIYESMVDTYEAIVDTVKRRFKIMDGSRLLSTNCSRCGQCTLVTWSTAAKTLRDDGLNSANIVLCNACAPNPLCDREVFLTERQRAVINKTRAEEDQ